MYEILIPSLSELPKAAIDFLNNTSGKKIFAFYGEMGAGKTTFIKEICKQLQVVNIVNSPTFSIMNEYLTENGRRIFHFDFYRIKNTSEAFDIGTEDYFYSGNFCFIEWPEKITALLPEETVTVQLNVIDKEVRQIVISDPSV